VPAGGGEVLHVLAGAPEPVERRGRQLCTAAWNYEVPGPADLVVATISGGPEEQTWENVGRALEAAGRVVDEDGAVVLCTDLSTDLGPSLRRLVDTRDVRAAGRRIRKDAGDDALPAARLADALHRTRVYLMSRLNEDLVEQLGMAPVANEGELSRLVGRHGRCILLANAHRAAAVVRESSP